MKLGFLIAFLVFIGRVSAHNGEHHHDEVREKAGDLTATYETINEQYKQSSVSNMFAQKCFDCHSAETKYPWYYKVPGIKTLIDNDIAEAREHLDMTKGFPFEGHGNALERLHDIKREITKGDMPPWLYRQAHAKSLISDQDKKEIMVWVNSSIAQLKAE